MTCSRFDWGENAQFDSPPSLLDSKTFSVWPPARSVHQIAGGDCASGSSLISAIQRPSRVNIVERKYELRKCSGRSGEMQTTSVPVRGSAQRFVAQSNSIEVIGAIQSCPLISRLIEPPPPCAAGAGDCRLQ